ncbi:hypothetical protein LIHA111178_02130 [Litorimonas haliclonae]
MVQAFAYALTKHDEGDLKDILNLGGPLSPNQHCRYNDNEESG